MKGKRNNNNFEYEDQRQTFRLSPRQLRRDRINPKMRVALTFTVYAAIPRACLCYCLQLQGLSELAGPDS